eukprot:scaffold23001_cov46-Cyclotella_meneghiniana.AAC.5
MTYLCHRRHKPGSISNRRSCIHRRSAGATNIVSEDFTTAKAAAAANQSAVVDGNWPFTTTTQRVPSLRPSLN